MPSELATGTDLGGTQHTVQGLHEKEVWIGVSYLQIKSLTSFSCSFGFVYFGLFRQTKQWMPSINDKENETKSI